MIKTLRLSFALKNTYRVNSILYALKQIPLLKKLLPASLYRSRGLKVFANVISILWELRAIFINRFLYFFTLVCGIGALYETLPTSEVFLHILLFLTLSGTLCNTSLLKPSKDKYYAMMLMRMDARAYTLTSYSYYTLTVIVGFMPFTLLYGLKYAVPAWLCALLPACVAGLKAFLIAITLWRYEKSGATYSENKLSGGIWLCMGMLLAAAYGLPALGLALPVPASMIIFLLGLPLGVIGFCKIFSFKDYYAVNRELLSSITSGMDTPTQKVKQANEKLISEDSSIQSKKKGFEYLNELFIKRHRKTLWKVTTKISMICLGLIAALQLAMAFIPELKPILNEGVLNSLPYFLFVMYLINRGTSFTQSLFMNCDHCLLTYAFYKKPSFILKLFVIRLKEIMKINAVPALVIGAGLVLTMYSSGGTDNPLNYAVLFVSVLCMSLFFSLHYLTLYYLLQPYNAGTEIKSGSYRIASLLTYLVCYFLMLQPVPSLLFGALTIAFVLIYCIVASILIYTLAPKTFKLRI